jgi:hypothetical protein
MKAGNEAYRTIHVRERPCDNPHEIVRKPARLIRDQLANGARGKRFAWVGDVANSQRGTEPRLDGNAPMDARVVRADFGPLPSIKRVSEKLAHVADSLREWFLTRFLGNRIATYKIRSF